MSLLSHRAAGRLLGGLIIAVAPAVLPTRGEAAEPVKPEPAQVSPAMRIGLAMLSTLAGADRTQPVVLGPASLEQLLQLLAHGARGETAAAFAGLLGTPVEAAPTQDEAASDPPDAAGTATAAGSAVASPPYRQAAAAWVSPSLELAEDYRRAVERQPNASVTALPGSTENALASINGWASQSTDGKVSKLLDRLPQETQLVLGTAASFTASWQEAFEVADTTEASFTTAAGKAVTVSMMSRELEKARYHKDEHAQVVRLAYGGDAAGMTADIILPGSRAALDACLTDEDPCNWARGAALRPRSGLLSLPRLSLTYQASLLRALETLGLSIATDPSRSDFSGMTKAAEDRGPVLSEIMSAAVLIMDEKGTEAAAASAAVLEPRSLTVKRDFQMVVDRPYLVIIRDQGDQRPLFMAYVTDPSAG